MSDLLNKASLVVIPSGYKEDTVYSVVPSDGSGDLSFTRASNGTRINSAGLVEVVPWNLVQNSEQFNAGTWSSAYLSISTNAATAPNGTTTADLVYPSSSQAYCYISTTSFNVIASQTYTQSVYFKRSGFRWGILDNMAGSPGAWFDLLNGVVGNVASGCTASIESVGNGWYRCSVSSVAPSSTNYADFRMSDSNGSDAVTANGTDGLYVWGFQINVGSTAKPYFPTTDRLNVPRLTYQNGGGGCPSLLLEKQSTNGLYPSEDFSTTWSLYNSATVTTNQATSPDGTQNADKLTTTNQATAIYNVNGAGTPAQAYTASLFIKYIDNTEFAIGMTDDVTGEAFARFNFTTGTATTTLQGDWTSISYTWEQQANGWYRISVSATKGASGNARFIGKGGGAYNYFIWGAQIEVSSYPTSYIPTTSASATRVADACFKTGISSLIGQTEGVLYWDGIALQGNYNQLMFIKDSSANQFIGITVGTQVIYGEIYNAGYIQLFQYSIGANDTTFKMALAYKTNDFVFYINGVQVASASTGTTPTSFDDFYLGNTNNLRDVNCQVKEAILFPTRLTNAELASLTTL